MVAITEALHAPAEVPTRTSGTMSRSSSALQHPHLADGLVAAAGEHERGACGCRASRRRNWLIEVLTGRSFLHSFHANSPVALGSSCALAAQFVWRGKAGAMLRPKSTPTTHTFIPARGREAHA